MRLHLYYLQRAYLVLPLLHSVDISMGFAFGLFAVFSMLRYRTESITVKEMTYLFLVIAISLLSAVSSASLFEMTLLHCIFLISALLCEFILVKQTFFEQFVQYEKIENITPGKKSVLIDDLTDRLGLNVRDVRIESIDLVRDCASLVVMYSPEPQSNKMIQSLNPAACSAGVKPD